MHIPHDRPTPEAYGQLQLAYDHFNDRLYGGRLPAVLITLQRKGRRTRGYFAPARFSRTDGTTAHELALNPAHFKNRTVIEILSTLVHEMTHVWQECFGKPGRRGYHNRQWAEEMLRIGLRPTTTGTPDGRLIGQSVTHYIMPGGRFEVAAEELLTSDFTITWSDHVAAKLEPFDPDQLIVRARSGVRVKFVCPACRAAAWGKASLELLCITCEQQLLPTP